MTRLRFEQTHINHLANANVNADDLIIHNVVAMQIGPGQDSRWLGVDLTTLHQMQDLGNAKQRGILMHFGHPGASDNAMGYQVARGKNFRVVGDRLVHDAELILHAKRSPVFSQDPLEYIMRMAEDYPNDIAESVVINGTKVWVLDDESEVDFYKEDKALEYDGDRPVRAIHDYPVLRIEKFHNVDFVIQGNLTPGGIHHQFAQAMFDETSVHGDLFELFNMADETRQRYDIPIEDIPSKIVQLGNSYLNKIGSEERITMDPLETNPVVPSSDDTTHAPPVSPVLAQAEIDALQQQVNALQTAQTETMTVSTEEYEGLQSRVATLEQQNKQLFGIMSALVQSHKTLQANQNTLDSKLRVLNNEQVVTTTVDNHAPMVTNQFMEQAFEQVGGQTPTHFAETETNQANLSGTQGEDPTSNNPVLATLMANNKRKYQPNS